MDKISLFVLVSFNIFGTAKFLAHNRSWNVMTSSILGHHLAMSVIILAEIMLIMGEMSFTGFSTIVRCLLPTIFALLLMQVSLLSIEELTSKKVMTLVKTPILGLLAGLFLEIKFIFLLCLGFFLISIFIFWRQKVRFRYPFKKLLLIAPSLIFFAFFDLVNLHVFNIGLIWFCIAIKVFNNLIFASNLFNNHENQTV